MQSVIEPMSRAGLPFEQSLLSVSLSTDLRSSSSVSSQPSNADDILRTDTAGMGAAGSVAVLDDRPTLVLVNATDTTTVATPPRGPLHAAIVALRPKQWIKNVLVFLAPVLAGLELHGSVMARAFLCFAALCLVASATYVVNDLRDVEADRMHPTKFRRPLAAGEISTQAALALSVTAAAAGLLVGFWAGGIPLVVVLVAYVALSMSYSYWFKHQAVIDISSLSMCYVLRILAGAVTTHANVPGILFLCIGFGALFMIVGKRFAEFRSLGDSRGSHRKVLAEYTENYLRALFYFAATATVLLYGVWAVGQSKAGQWAMCFELSVIPAVMILMQYALLVEHGEGGSPENLVLGDRRLQVLGAIAGLLFVLGAWHGIPGLVVR